MKDFNNKNENSRDRNPQKKSSRIDGATIGWLYIYTFYMYSFLFFAFLFLSRFFGSDRQTALFDTRTISRAQQAYFLERNNFSRQLLNLGIGQSVETERYSYRIIFPSQPARIKPFLTSEFHDLSAIASIAYPKDEHLRVYIGIVRVMLDPNTDELTTQVNFCRSASSVGALQSQGYINFGFPYVADFYQTDVNFSCPVHFEDIEG